MGKQDDGCPFVKGIIDRGKNGPDPGVIGNILGIIQGNVKIKPAQNLFPF
jgi:hypothetical protein